MIKMAYITADFTSVHKDLLMALGRQGTKTKLLFYSRNKTYAAPEDLEDAVFYRFNTLSRGPFLFELKHKKVARHFEELLKNDRVDILHGNMFFVDGYVCRYLSKKYGIPYVVSVRFTDMYAWFFWKLPWIKKLGLKNLTGSSAVIFLSEAYKEELLGRLPGGLRDEISKKSFVVPNGVNTFWLDNKYDKERKLGEAIRFITVGLIEARKNQDTVAAALERYARDSKRSIEYVVVGKSLDQAMKQKLAGYSFVRIKEHMEKEELIEEYRKADIFVLASHAETFGLVYPEAMSQGLPVIYSKGQGFDGHFEDGVVGKAVDSHSADDIYSGIVRVVDDYEKMSRNALDRSSCFDWDDVAKNMNEVYASCIK